MLEKFVNFDEKKIVALTLEYSGKALGFILLVILSFIVAKYAKKISFTALKKAKVDTALASFLSKIIRYLVLAFGVIVALGFFGVETASFAAVIASAGFAVGMALQGTLGNFAAGIMLLLFKPFKIGDTVQIGDKTGTVMEIDIFTTKINTFDNKRIIMPNGPIFAGTIENLTFNSTRRISVDVGTSYSSDIDETRAVLLAAIKGISYNIGEPAPVVLLVKLGASSIDWSVRIWVKTEDVLAAQDELTRVVKYTLDKERISIPFPQMDVHLNKLN